MRAAPAVLFALLAAAVLWGCGPPGPPERIVLVVVDTLRRDALGAYGGDGETPAIDRLARDGQRFSNAMASFHQTTMSMGAIFTGRTPSLESGDVGSPIPFVGRTWCGMARFDPEDTREQCLPPGVKTLAEHFADAGYETIGVTSNSLLFDPYGLSRGFDDWVEVGDVPASGSLREIVSSLASRTARVVNESVGEALSRRRGDRFFLYVHYMDVHDYQMQEATQPRPVDNLREKYRRAVGDADRAVGELLAMLEREDLLADSVVVFTSDHGERLGEAHLVRGRPTHTGNPSFREVLEVPLLVSPARFARPDDLVRGTDLFGLLVGLAGAEASPAALGSGETFTSELGWLTYARGRWKSYTRRDDRGLWLVDLGTDPKERRNVADENPEVAQMHWDRVTALAERLAVRRTGPDVLSAQDEARLRALGYLAPADLAPADFEPTDRESAVTSPKPEAPHGTASDAGAWRPPLGAR